MRKQELANIIRHATTFKIDHSICWYQQWQCQQKPTKFIALDVPDELSFNMDAFNLDVHTLFDSYITKQISLSFHLNYSLYGTGTALNTFLMIASVVTACAS